MNSFNRYLLQHSLARLIVADIEAYDSQRVLWTWPRVMVKTITVWRQP
jgi:hypothetical protein